MSETGRAGATPDTNPATGAEAAPAGGVSLDGGASSGANAGAQAAPKKKSDLRARVLSGVPAAVAVLALLAFGTMQAVGIFVTLIALVGVHEYRRMLEAAQVRLQPAPLYGGAALLGLSATFYGAPGLGGALAAVFVFLAIHGLVLRDLKSVGDILNLGLLFLGLLLIGWGLSHLTLVKGLEHGVAKLFMLLVIIWVSDTAAYFGGRSFGKTPLAPKVSPKKTIEGSACGAAGAGLAALVFAAAAPVGLGLAAAFGLGVVVALVGQAGDLVESRLKRLCGVKDSGMILPGHGGALDRVDGFLTAAPVFYYAMLYFSA